MTTVGYGDLYPTTGEGRFVIIILMYISCLYMAIPIGIIGKTFSNAWDNRERVLVLNKLRNHVKKAGYTPYDLHEMFMMLDSDGNSDLHVDEFVELMPLMTLDMPENVAREVFDSFADPSGTLDFRDFLRGIYPTTH